MAVAILPTQDVAAIEIPRWSWMVLVFALLGSYLMLQENGLLTSHWMAVHEFFHDSCHALGMPCH